MTSKLRLTGHERLYGSSAIQGDAMILDFWRWAFSDLRANSVREVFAEWMVAKLLDIRLGLRDVQKEYDLIAPNGVRIEVKTAAYLQTQEQAEQPSQIVFSGLRARKRDAQARRHLSPTAYNADFCQEMRARVFQVTAARLIRALGKSYNASVN